MSVSAISTTLVGSHPQPDWLIDREALAKRLPPRLRARELWRIDPQWLREAQDDAVALAIRDQERAGLDIITDGEIAQSGVQLSVLEQLAGKTIILGVLALDTDEVESAGQVADHRGARSPTRRRSSSWPPDCGMKYLSRNAAFAKLQAMVAGARQASA